MHVAAQGNVDYVGGAQDVGLDRLEGIDLGRWNLFERRSVDHKVHSVHHPVDPFPVPHVADEHP